MNLADAVQNHELKKAEERTTSNNSKATSLNLMDEMAAKLQARNKVREEKRRRKKKKTPLLDPKKNGMVTLFIFLFFLFLFF